MFKSSLSRKEFPKTGYGAEYISELHREYGLLSGENASAPFFSSFKKYFTDGERLPYEREYFALRRRLCCFALTEWLGEADCRDELEETIEIICRRYTWALPAHIENGADITEAEFNSGTDDTIDLFAAETAQSLAEIISLLSDRLSEGIKEKCIREINRRVLVPFETRCEPYGWESSKSNWSAVCGGSIGMTAIYLIDDEARLNAVLSSLKPAFDSYMQSFTPDGACLEGLYYWNYGMLYFTAFLDLYRQRFHRDYPIDTDKMRKMARFSDMCCISGGVTVSFSDSAEKDKIYAGLSAYLSHEYGAPMPDREYIALYSGDECARWCKAARDVAWTPYQNNAQTPRATALNDAQWAKISRGGVTAVFKGGNNGEPHNHNDVGNIIVVKDGVTLLCDMGKGEYTREYFSENRYNIFCTSSEGHSVPIINGHAQGIGARFCAKDFYASDSEIRADISGAYDVPALKKCVRRVRFDGDALEISDEFKLSSAAQITERFITRLDARTDGEGVTLLCGGKPIARLTAAHADNVSITRRVHRNHEGLDEQITVINFHMKSLPLGVNNTLACCRRVALATNAVAKEGGPAKPVDEVSSVFLLKLL